MAGTFTGKQAEADLHQLILDCCVDDVVLKYVLPEEKPLGWEGPLWDYKKELPNTSGHGSNEDRARANVKIVELIKDAVSFHNSYGGIIVAGIDQYGKYPIVSENASGIDFFEVDKFNDQLASYARKKITCRFRKVALLNGTQIGILLIPMRRIADSVVVFAKGAPENGAKRQAFRKGDIYARIDDACIPIQKDIQALQFVCSKRSLSDAAAQQFIENSLPLKDPELIRFVGRAEYLIQLWQWLTDRHAPIKILTALGGTGKTTIAYEFCRQILDSPPAWSHKLVWLTAKTQAFSAVRGEWVKVTRTDFSSVDGLCAALARELGATDDELAEADDRHSLLDLVLNGLEHLPSLIVIDDVDTLGVTEQSDLIGTVQTLAGRSFASGSRFLLTSRLELGASDSQRIAVKGFEEGDFEEYAKMVAVQRGIVLNSGLIKRLHTASLGSPTFCASILRLASFGVDINSAIKSWKGKEGEAVRRFAFARELEQLSDSEARALYALSALGETTQLELSQILNVEASLLTRDLSRLRDYHLFTAGGDPSTGAKLETPEPIRLMSDVLRARIADPTRIENECARARRNVPKLQSKASTSIAAILALWKADDYEAALLTAEQAVKKSSSNSDIHCALGQCYLKVTPPRPDAADKSFRQAKVLNCTRSELLPNWLEAKVLKNDWAGIIDLFHTLPPTDFRGRSVSVVAKAFVETASQQLARSDEVRALDSLKKVFTVGSGAIKQQRAGDQLPILRAFGRDAARQYVQLVCKNSVRAGDRLDVFNSVLDAFNAHITETWMIELALESLQAWASDALNRKRDLRDTKFILQSKLDDLGRMRRHFAASGWDRVDLVHEIETVEHKLSRYLK